MPEPRLLLDRAMVERAARSFAENGDMEAAIRAAFDGVPLSNFAIGTLLEPFDLVVCMVDGGGVGVFASNGDPDGFEHLPHRARLTYGRGARLSGLAISGIDWPEQEEDGDAS